MGDLLFNIYLGSFLFGGILLAASLVLGGKDTGGFDGDADLDVDADFDLDADADADLDKDLGPDVAIDSDAGGLLPWFLLSFRFWVYFTAFFGLSGMLFAGLDLMGVLPTLATSIGVGTSAGYFVSKLIRHFANDSAARSAGASDFVGKSARVLVAPRNGGAGQVRVRVRGQMVDVLAVTDQELNKNDEVLVIEMEGTRARVARLD